MPVLIGKTEKKRGGGVCIYIANRVPVERLPEFETDHIESIWVRLSPYRTPRNITAILIGNIYHPMSYKQLYQHIQSNVDSFLRKHPSALILICGDFNPVATGFKESILKRKLGIKQIISSPTRAEAILDLVFTNQSRMFEKPLLLFNTGASDHNTILYLLNR